LKTQKTFSFETVFSHPDKVKYIDTANQSDYRTYLYFVSTNSPEINNDRVNVSGASDIGRGVDRRYYSGGEEGDDYSVL